MESSIACKTILSVPTVYLSVSTQAKVRNLATGNEWLPSIEVYLQNLTDYDHLLFFGDWSLQEDYPHLLPVDLRMILGYAKEVGCNGIRVTVKGAGAQLPLPVYPQEEADEMSSIIDDWDVE